MYFLHFYFKLYEYIYIPLNDTVAIGLGMSAMKS